MSVSGPSIPKHAAFFARVQGWVQGVGFRYTCLHEARLRGLRGWVRNTPGGDVEVWAEGLREKLDIFLQWLRRGPPGARVDAMDYSLHAPTGAYKDFRIDY
ncbi:MAG: acylphosphatase [Treponema sp.]|nr:acylphosphatase [Treponema sp.]